MRAPHETHSSQLVHEPKACLVTGVARFISSNILETFLKLNQSVIAIDNPATGKQPILDEVRDLDLPKKWARFTFILGDLRNLRERQISCADVNYDLRQAALGFMPRSINDPSPTNQANIDGWLNSLLAARDNKVTRFPCAASSSDYCDHPGLPKVKDNIGNPL